MSAPAGLARLRGRAVSVRVPATSANLGPGFDTLGLALALYDELEARVREEPGVHVTVHGVGADEVPTDEQNLVVRGIATAFDDCGLELPGLEIVTHNEIPHGRGLGSSGAAIVAGLMVAKGLLSGIEEFDSNRLLALATRMEGHPDNVAPALFGGLTIAWVGASGPRYKKLIVHRGVSPVLLVPEAVMSTSLARSLQPESVPHEDAVFNLSRSALLVAALTQSPELLWEATEDKLHQSYRASAMPETVELIGVLRDHGYAAVVSGAGPSILVLAGNPVQRLGVAGLVEAHTSTPWRAILPAVDFRGARAMDASERIELHPRA